VTRAELGDPPPPSEGSRRGEDPPEGAEITLPPAPIHHTPRWVYLLWRTLELLALLGAGALAVLAVLTANGWQP